MAPAYERLSFLRMVHSAADLPNLTAEEAMDLFRQVHANAVELVDEAQLLLAANHRSRAYFLGHLAHEEIAKCVGLLSIWCGLQIGSPANRELFWRRWNSHGFKYQ